MEFDEQLVAVRAEGIGARIVAARLRHDHLHLRRLGDQRPHRRSGLGRFCQRNSRREISADPDDAFVQLRQKLGADAGGKQARSGHRREAERHHQPRPADGTANEPLLAGEDPAGQRILPVSGAALEDVGRKRGARVIVSSSAPTSAKQTV